MTRGLLLVLALALACGHPTPAPRNPGGDSQATAIPIALRTSPDLDPGAQEGKVKGTLMPSLWHRIEVPSGAGSIGLNLQYDGEIDSADVELLDANGKILAHANQEIRNPYKIAGTPRYRSLDSTEVTGTVFARVVAGPGARLASSYELTATFIPPPPAPPSQHHACDPLDIDPKNPECAGFVACDPNNPDFKNPVCCSGCAGDPRGCTGAVLPYEPAKDGEGLIWVKLGAAHGINGFSDVTMDVIGKDGGIVTVPVAFFRIDRHRSLVSMPLDKVDAKAMTQMPHTLLVRVRQSIGCGGPGRPRH